MNVQLFRAVRRKPLVKGCAALLLFVLYSFTQAALAQLTGAIYTTDSICNGTDLNIYAAKADVYLDGGPRHEGAAGLPDGEYYVQVTEPNGTLLGTSLGAADETPVLVVNGQFDACYRLVDILIRPDLSPGYVTTSNPGGEYKVWVSSTADFAPSNSKTDNFKVKGDDTTPPTDVDEARLRVSKFYDANVNGVNDDLQDITGWMVRILDGIDLIRFTPVDTIVAPDDYFVSEFLPIETNWVATTPTDVEITLAANDDALVEFGNVCLGAGGGKTLGFWSNKNGERKMSNAPGGMTAMLNMLGSSNLRNANGSFFVKTNYKNFRTWLLGANATNMAYMLSAQLAAMKLNTVAGDVSGGSMVYAPQLLPHAPVSGLNGLGFISISDLIAAAQTELGINGNTTSGTPGDFARGYQEALKDALDEANNNMNFVQGSPCAFSFADVQ